MASDRGGRLAQGPSPRRPCFHPCWVMSRAAAREDEAVGARRRPAACWRPGRSGFGPRTWRCAHGWGAGWRRGCQREVGRMAVRKITHPSVNDREAKGLEARNRAPLSSHMKWRPAADQPGSGRRAGAAGRHPGAGPGAGTGRRRMMVSPFTFYRGGAAIMAADLAATPVAADGPAVRGRPPVELRRVRLAGAAAAVRPERLRRDTAGRSSTTSSG